MQAEATTQSPGLSPGPGPETREAPLRRCIVSRGAFPRAQLIRFVLGPDGTLLPDLEGRLPGRGLWLQARRDVVETACAKGSFARAARTAVKVPDGLADRLEALLRRRCLDLVGLARRAGQLAAGFEQVRGWLEAERAAVLLEASDGAAGGRAKLIGSASALPLVTLFTAAELGAALGREQAVHVALAPGALAERLVAEASRLAGFVAAGGVSLPAADEAGTP